MTFIHMNESHKSNAVIKIKQWHRVTNLWFKFNVRMPDIEQKIFNHQMENPDN